MGNTLLKANVDSGMKTGQIDHSQMPLSFLKAGDSAQVAKVRGKGEMHHHLETLGFVEGADLSVVCESGGNLIVEIKGAQVALNKQVAAKIVTK